MKIKFFTIFGAIMSVIVIWFCLYISPDKSFNYVAGTILCGGGGCFIFNVMVGVIFQAFFPYDKPKAYKFSKEQIEQIQSIIDDVRNTTEFQGNSYKYALHLSRSETINNKGIDEIIHRAGIWDSDLCTLQEKGKVKL